MARCHASHSSRNGPSFFMQVTTTVRSDGGGACPVHVAADVAVDGHDGPPVAPAC